MGRRSKKPDSGINGCIVCDKPPGITSHDVVDIVRKKFGTRRVGHAGTLDPDATGVLVLGVGIGTKLLQFVTGSDKSYIGTISFGTETSTLDAAGEVTATYEMSLDVAQVQKAARRFIGDIEQIPPMVSAVRVNGKRLHELAREGKEVERDSRSVRVDKFSITSTDDPLVFQADVDCSSGTYIRTLAADLGHSLDGGAHLSSLRRSSVGAFTLDGACQIDDLVIQSEIELLRGYPIIEVAEDVARQVRNGRPLGASSGAGLVGIKDTHGDLLAVYQVADGELKPAKVLARK